jgi:hypothetical protein
MRDSEIDRSRSSACPRCLTGDARMVARSPRPGVWTMHLCAVCFYTWRILYMAKHRAGLCDQ